jgi:5'(3')-deoxyribonucleotidase
MIKRIGLDLDCTFADFMSGAIPKMREMFGVEPKEGSKPSRIEQVMGLVPKGPTNKWDKLGIDRDNYQKLKEVKDKLYLEGNLFRTLPLLENDSPDLTNYLKENGYKIYFITARDRHPIIVKDTIYWLENNNFHFDDVFFSDEKHFICDKLDIQTMVEDHPQEILPCLSKGINVIAMSQEWNAGLDLSTAVGRFQRIISWKEIPSLLETKGF